jgi:hypothetical protein
VLVEVECDTLEQVGEALTAGAALILLDNMSLDQMRSAVTTARAYPAAKLEASGGLRLENAMEVASTGVHYLSVGALTHSSPALDLALDMGLPAYRGRRYAAIIWTWQGAGGPWRISWPHFDCLVRCWRDCHISCSLRRVRNDWGSGRGD